MARRKEPNNAYATVVLGKGIQSRRVRMELRKIARENSLSLEQATARVLKWGICNQVNIARKGIRADKVLIREHPKLKEAVNVRIVVDSQTKSQLDVISTRNGLTRLQAYNNILDATLEASKRDQTVAERIIKVDPIEPWPNELTKEFK